MSKGEVWTIFVLWAVVTFPLREIFGEGSWRNQLFKEGVGVFWLALVLVVKARRERRSDSRSRV